MFPLVSDLCYNVDTHSNFKTGGNTILIIRRAQPGDIPRILDLLTQVNLVHHLGRPDLFKKNTKYDHADLEAILKDETRPIFVAADEKNDVKGYGFCIFEQTTGDRILTDIKTLYIDDICVDETARGQHIGRQIYEAITAFAKESGCYHITLNVWSLNPVAQKFYESLGMTPMKVTMESLL